MNPCSLRLDGDGLTVCFGGGGNWIRGTLREDRVAAEEVRVLTARVKGR